MWALIMHLLIDFQSMHKYHLDSSILIVLSILKEAKICSNIKYTKYFPYNEISNKLSIFVRLNLLPKEYTYIFRRGVHLILRALETRAHSHSNFLCSESFS